MKKIFSFYINSSIHVALSVCGLIGITWLEFELLYDFKLILFSFFGSITAYNFVKYASIARLHHSKLTKSLKAIQIFSLLSFIILIYYALQLDLILLLSILPFGFLTLLYAVPVFSKSRNLRSLPGQKVLVISIVWSGVTVLIPIINANYIIDANVWIEFIKRFLFVIVLMLPFEVRDLAYDNLRLKTIPQKLGTQKTKILGIFLLSLNLGLTFFNDQKEGYDKISVLLITIITLLFLWNSKEKQSKYYSSFGVESIPIVWFIIMCVTKVLFS